MRRRVTQTKVFKLKLDPNEKEDTFPRVLIYHKVQVKNKSLDIFHTHLCFDRIGRQLNIKDAIKYISHFDHNKYTIIIGDFNASPSDRSIKQLLNHKFKNKRFHDLGTITKNNSPTWSVEIQLIDNNWKLKNPQTNRPWKINPTSTLFIT